MDVRSTMLQKCMTMTTTEMVNVSWETYETVMRDRYEDGKKETKSIIYGALERKLKEFEETDVEHIGLQLAIDAIKGAKYD